jgi:hypothetical protein
MRRLTILLGVVVLVAGCTASAGATPGTSPGAVAHGTAGAAPSSAATVAPSAKPSASPVALKARVTFDGTACVYAGPPVLPFGATLAITYAPTPAQEGSFVGMFAVHSDATRADFMNVSNPNIGEGTPSFVYGDTAHFGQGSGTWDYPVTWVNGSKPYDTYMLVCVPKIPGRPVDQYTLLKVVDASSSQAASPAP